MKKKIHSFRKVFYFIIVFLGFTSCSKTVDTWNIPDEFQSWCRFREGSYWIYRNEKTLQLDCTYVTQYTYGTYPYEGDEYKVEYYYDRESSEITGSFLHEIIAWSGSKDFANMSLYTTFCIINFSTDLISNPRYVKAWYDGQESQGVVAVYATEEVNGNTFDNVYHCRVESQSWDGDSIIADGHLVKNIGLIEYKKRIDQVDTTWTLVRWHVNQ